MDNYIVNGDYDRALTYAIYIRDFAKFIQGLKDKPILPKEG